MVSSFTLLGATLYQRVLLVFVRHLEYWEEHNMPIYDLFSQNPTFFSEESGEIALSVLAQSLPKNHSGDIKDTSRYVVNFVLFDNSPSKWKQVRLRVNQNRTFEEDLHIRSPRKKHRMLSMALYPICFISEFL
jgi:hypothetical protein